MKDFLNIAEQQRLIEAIFSLKSRKFIRSISDLCVKCGKNKSYFNDVRTKNLNFSADFISKVFELYPINEQYVLTGNGEILLSPGNATAQTKEVNAPGSVQNNTPSSAPKTAIQCAVDTSAFEIERLKSVCEERERTISVLSETNKNLLAEVQQLRNYVNITSTKYIQVVEKTLEAARQTNATVQQFQAQIGFHHAEQPHHTIAAHHNDKNH